ncbi:MAG: hypothetical protein ACREOF_05840 [Gemmatimonadales bacterium]
MMSRAGFLLITLLVPPPLRAQDAAGVWFGERITGGGSRYTVLTLEREGAGGIAMFPLAGMHDMAEVTFETAGPDSLRIAVPLGGDTARLAGRIRGHELSGSLHARDGEGRFRFLRMMAPDTALAARHAETYGFAPDSLLVIENAEHRLFYLETGTGRTGRLLPADADSFWSGPSPYVYYPVERQATFRRHGPPHGGDARRA